MPTWVWILIAILGVAVVVILVIRYRINRSVYAEYHNLNSEDKAVLDDFRNWSAGGGSARKSVSGFASYAQRESYLEPEETTPQIVDNDADIGNLIAELGRRDILGPNPALNKIREKGASAIPHLLRVLDSGNVTAVVDAINLLMELDASEAAPKIDALSRSQWAEVSQAAYTALAVLDKKSASGLAFDRQQPFGQIGRLWTAIVQGQQELYLPEVLNGWCLEAIDAMPDMKFSSNEDQAKAWGMLGSLVFKSMHPEWPGGFDGTKPCPEAKRCYEEALRYEPGDGWWQGWVDRFSEPTE